MLPGIRLVGFDNGQGTCHRLVFHDHFNGPAASVLRHPEFQKLRIQFIVGRCHGFFQVVYTHGQGNRLPICAVDWQFLNYNFLVFVQDLEDRAGQSGAVRACLLEDNGSLPVLVDPIVQLVDLHAAVNGDRPFFRTQRFPIGRQVFRDLIHAVGHIFKGDNTAAVGDCVPGILGRIVVAIHQFQLEHRAFQPSDIVGSRLLEGDLSCNDGVDNGQLQRAAVLDGMAHGSAGLIRDHLEYDSGDGGQPLRCDFGTLVQGIDAPKQAVHAESSVLTGGYDRVSCNRIGIAGKGVCSAASCNFHISVTGVQCEADARQELAVSVGFHQAQFSLDLGIAHGYGLLCLADCKGGLFLRKDVTVGSTGLHQGIAAQGEVFQHESSILTRHKFRSGGVETGIGVAAVAARCGHILITRLNPEFGAGKTFGSILIVHFQHRQPGAAVCDFAAINGLALLIHSGCVACVDNHRKGCGQCVAHGSLHFRNGILAKGKIRKPANAVRSGYCAGRSDGIAPQVCSLQLKLGSGQRCGSGFVCFEECQIIEPFAVFHILCIGPCLIIPGPQIECKNIRIDLIPIRRGDLLYIVGTGFQTAEGAGAVGPGGLLCNENRGILVFVKAKAGAGKGCACLRRVNLAELDTAFLGTICVIAFYWAVGGIDHNRDASGQIIRDHISHRRFGLFQSVGTIGQAGKQHNTVFTGCFCFDYHVLAVVERKLRAGQRSAVGVRFL